MTIKGDGSGTVTSDVGSIDCPGTCADDISFNAAVVLTAAPDDGTTFAGWRGDCSGTDPTCTLTMDDARNATATFLLPQHLVDVSKNGPGSGVVTSDVGGIDCGVSCSAVFDHGSAVQLTAVADPEMVFSGWSGACTGTSPTCDLTVDDAMLVGATFTFARHILSVATQGSGDGSVTSDVGDIACPVACSDSYDHGSAVELTALAGATSTFSGWGGACAGTSSTCDVTMADARDVTATFAPLTHGLSVSKTGTGTGQVTSDFGGINCPGICSADFAHGAIVQLTASPGGGSAFAGWGGACTGTGPCLVTMDAATAVTATFNPVSTATTLRDDDPSVAYNGWFGVSDPTASGGAYRVSTVKNDIITWKSPVTTSLTWVTRTGPDRGKASVTIDGTSKGTVDLYTHAPARLDEVFSGLTKKAHAVVIKVLGTKNGSSNGLGVVVDAFVAGSATTEESDLKVQWDAWTSTSQSGATDGAYRSSASASSTVKVSFTGTSIDWKTARGKAYGKASVKIDGAGKGTFDLYQASTVWQYVISFTGLSSGSHTLTIQVLGQKTGAATGKTVVVDGFVVHS